MKLAFSRPTASPQEQTDLFNAYRQVGYDGLQLKPNQYQPYLTEPQRFIDAWGDRPGLTSGLISLGRLDDEGQAALQTLFRFAGAVGAERIVFVHAVPRDQITPEAIRQIAGVMAELGRAAQGAGVALSLHHHYNQPVMHYEEMVCFFEALPSQTVGLTVDTAHLVKSGIDDVAGVIRTFEPVIDNLHLKDFAAGAFRVLGDGAIDFEPVFAAIHETGYDGWLCADEESGGDLRRGLENCYQFLQAGLSQ